MKIPLVAALLLAAVAVRVPDAAAKQWKNSAELSYLTTNGNTKTQSLSGKDSYTYDFNAETKAEIEAGGHGARSEGRLIAEQYFGWEKVSRMLTDRDYVFERYRWDRNVFAGVEHRHDFSVGLGRELWKTDKDLLVGELAPGYSNEERVNAPRKSFASARGYAKYTRAFSETVKFSQDVEYVQSLKESRDSRTNTETSLTAALTEVLSTKNSFIWRHDSRPPDGKRKDDTIFAVSLIASF